MNSLEFKNKTSHLNPKTKVQVSCFTKDYTLSHEEVCNSFSLEGSELIFREGNDLAEAPSLEDFYKLSDNEIITIDIEDGFVFRPIGEVLVFPNKVVLLAK